MTDEDFALKMETQCLKHIGKYFEGLYKGDTNILPNEVADEIVGEEGIPKDSIIEFSEIYDYLLARVIEVGIVAVSKEIAGARGKPDFCVKVPFEANELCPYPEKEKFEFYVSFRNEIENDKIAEVLGDEFVVYRGIFYDKPKGQIYRYFKTNEEAWQAGASRVMKLSREKDGSMGMQHMCNAFGFDHHVNTDHFDHMVQTESGAWVQREKKRKLK